MTTDTDTRPLFLRKRYPRRGQPDRTTQVVVNPTNAQPYARKALSEEVANVTTAVEGTRNDTLNRAAYNLSQLVAGGYLNHDDTWHALHTAALSTGLPEHEVTTTLRSAFRAGTQEPRTVAQHDAQDVPEAFTVTPPPGDTPEDDTPSLRDRFPVLDWHDLWTKEDEEEWIIKPLLPARRLVALFSAPKVGKSLLTLEMAVAIARGTEFLGYTPKEPLKVLYVDFENDPRGDVRSRLKAMGLHPEDLENLCYLSMPRLAYLDTNIGGLELLAVAQEYGCVVVIIDTISRAVNGEENENDTWLSFYRNTGVLLKSQGIACLRLDHTGKDATKGMRGGSAKYGDVDAVWSLTRITDDTFRLECTDNRLPITEKVLNVERRSDPNLHHHVTTRSTGELWRTQEQRIAAELDRLGFPVAPKGTPGAGYPSAREKLALAGLSGEDLARRRIEKALDLRRQEDYHGGVALPWGEDT